MSGRVSGTIPCSCQSPFFHFLIQHVNSGRANRARQSLKESPHSIPSLRTFHFVISDEFFLAFIEDFSQIIHVIKHRRDFNFTAYKCSSRMRRVSKGTQALGIESFSDYQNYLKMHPEEFGHLFNTILINVTTFFRDPPAWDYLTSACQSRN